LIKDDFSWDSIEFSKIVDIFEDPYASELEDEKHSTRKRFVTQ
jgi:acyl carrier protein